MKTRFSYIATKQPQGLYILGQGVTEERENLPILPQEDDLSQYDWI